MAPAWNRASSHSSNGSSWTTGSPSLPNPPWAPVAILGGCWLRLTLHSGTRRACSAVFENTCSEFFNSSRDSLHPCCLVFLWTRVRGGRNTRFGCAVNPARVVSTARLQACQCHPHELPGSHWRVLGAHVHTIWSPALANTSAKVLKSMSNRTEHTIWQSLAATQLLLARVLRITHRDFSASPQVPIDSSLRSFRSCCDGEEVLCVNSGDLQASDFDVLRQHDQRHELSARYRLCVDFVLLHRPLVHVGVRQEAPTQKH